MNSTSQFDRQIAFEPEVRVLVEKNTLAANRPRRGTERELLGLMARVQGEYREALGMSLTLSQAQRLFGLSAEQCQRVFDDLVRRGFLVRKGGQFRQPSGV